MNSCLVYSIHNEQFLDSNLNNIEKVRVFRRILREVKQSGEIHLVVDCSVEKITQLLKASLYTLKKRFAIFQTFPGGE
jgi:hypothetical protein